MSEARHHTRETTHAASWVNGAQMRPQHKLTAMYLRFVSEEAKRPEFYLRPEHVPQTGKISESHHALLSNICNCL
jgi:hypothetical protein